MLELYAHPEPVNKGALASILTRGSNTINVRIRELSEINLIIETEEDKHPWRKFVELTPEGKYIAKHLKAIEDALPEKIV